ncbi:MAG: pyruvate kinase [Clostridia bacterium]|nr:pyruvate kinase [Clostridia bacterium]
MNRTEKADNGKKVRIYGTLGPSCKDADTLRRMIEEGMSGVRLNLSHTMLDEASELIEAFHNAALSCGATPELLIDLQGPELRVGELNGPLTLKEGELINAQSLEFPKEAKTALLSAPRGTGILLDDGKLLLEKEEANLLRVVRGGILESRKSVAIQHISIATPALTQADRRNIARAKEFGVTAVMQPFVRGKADLIEVRGALEASGCKDIRLLAKIENSEGMAALSEIIPFCDEIVIARGDLGNSMPLWELPAAQKRIAEVCRESGMAFMVVTQMLDSMMRRPVPTRAEVSDIFNAVLDGASSVMVTGETAVGKYPVDTILYLVKTAREAERFIAESIGN